MSENSRNLDIKQYETQSCTYNRPDLESEDLLFLIERARKLSNIDNLDKYAIRSLAERMEEFIPWFEKNISNSGAQVQKKIDQFKNGEITLYQLHEWTIDELFKHLKPDSDIAQELVAIKTKVFHTLKGIVSSHLKDEGWRDANHAIDELNNPELSERGIDDAKEEDEEKSAKKDLEASIKEILRKVLRELKKVSNIKAIRIEYNDPFSDALKLISMGNITGNNTNNFTGEMQFGKRKIGKIEYIFDGDREDGIIEGKCERVTDELDTYLDSKLQNVLEKHIQAELERILEAHYIHDWNKLNDWRSIFREFFEVAYKALPDADMTFFYKRDDLVTDGRYGYIKIRNGEIFFDDFDDDGSVPELRGHFAEELTQESDANIEVFPFRYKAFLDREYLKEKGFDADECERMGALITTYEHSTDLEIADTVASCFQRLLERREDLRGRFAQIVGLNKANELFNSPTKKWEERELALAVGDINSYTLFSEAVKEKELKDSNTPKDLLPEIMDFFSQEISFIIERDKKEGTIISREGDSIIVYFGEPSAEKDKTTYTLNALKQCAETQAILDEVLDKIEAKYGIILPWRPKFSWGIKSAKEVAGIFGNPRNPYSQSQWSVYGKHINEAARIQSAAPKGSILMDYDTFLELKAKGIDDFVQIGEPYYAWGKNVKDPMPVVLVMEKEKHEELERKKHEVLQKKHGEREEQREAGIRSSILFYDENDCDQLPDGDYKVKSVGPEESGPVVYSLVSGKFQFPVCIDRDRITGDDEYVAISDETDQQLKKEFNEKRYSGREVLRKIGNTFMIIKHRNIEEIVEGIISKIKVDNRRKNQEHFKIDQLPAGRYTILPLQDDMGKEDNYYYFFLMRGEETLKLKLKKDENHLRGAYKTSGTFVHEKGFCECI